MAANISGGVDEFPESDESEEVACFEGCYQMGHAFLPVRGGLMLVTREQRDAVAQAASASGMAEGSFSARITE